MCFRKKKTEPEPSLEPKVIPCAHKYRDFPWYAETLFTFDAASYGENKGRYQIKVIKPYACVHCGSRKNVEVDHLSQVRVDWNDVDDIKDRFLTKYDEKLQPQGMVEEAINDMLLVDRAYLKVIDDLNSARTAPSPFQTN